MQPGQTVRKLFFDRLKMTMPTLKREDLIEHEESVASRRYYQKQERAIHALWRHQLSTLAVHMDEVVEESQFLQQQMFAKEEEQRKFDNVRVEMTRKLLEWNNKRFEESRKAAAAAADSAERQREWEEKEAAREKKVRTIHKKRIKVFRDERQREREAVEAEAARAEELAASLAEEQNEVNVVRTEYVNNGTVNNETALHTTPSFCFVFCFVFLINLTPVGGCYTFAIIDSLASVASCLRQIHPRHLR